MKHTVNINGQLMCYDELRNKIWSLSYESKNNNKYLGYYR